MINGASIVLGHGPCLGLGCGICNPDRGRRPIDGHVRCGRDLPPSNLQKTSVRRSVLPPNGHPGTAAGSNIRHATRNDVRPGTNTLRPTCTQAPVAAAGQRRPREAAEAPQSGFPPTRESGPRQPIRWSTEMRRPMPSSSQASWVNLCWGCPQFPVHALEDSVHSLERGKQARGRVRT